MKICGEKEVSLTAKRWLIPTCTAMLHQADLGASLQMRTLLGSIMVDLMAGTAQAHGHTGARCLQQ